MCSDDAQRGMKSQTLNIASKYLALHISWLELAIRQTEIKPKQSAQKFFLNSGPFYVLCAQRHNIKLHLHVES